MKIALQSAKSMGLTTPGLETVLGMFEDLAASGEAESGTQALYKWLEQRVHSA